jgi:flavin-dependent dehydrogenase
LRNSRIERGRCEIYFFPGGYGGLNRVEKGLANHCFLIDARIVRKFNGNADRIVREVVFKNRRAAKMLETAETAHDWLAVSVDSFGRKNLAPAARMLAIGDAGAFIDPFTGSGMLMALESAEIAARVIAENFPDFEKISAVYQNLHQAKFSRRLRVCSVLRRAAFLPNLAATAIYALRLSNSARFFLARATRQT